jgi:hypothetical protein
MSEAIDRLTDELRASLRNVDAMIEVSERATPVKQFATPLDELKDTLRNIAATSFQKRPALRVLEGGRKD